MAERLHNDDAPTMALIGPLGSGKSTIYELVARRLQTMRNVRLIHVTLWPFDSAEAAVRGILRAIIEELGRQVNVLPLVGFSEDYITAIEKSAGAYGGMARMLRGTSDPEKIIQQLSEIVCAAGLRLVLWIEDLERFSGGSQLEGDARDEREVERLGPIRALLYLLDRCREVSIIVSDTSLRTRFDIGKIARFVEQPPRMEAESVWKFTDLIRTQCLNGYPVAVIDPTAPQLRQAFVPVQDSSRLREWLSEFRDGDDHDVLGAMVRVLETPRALKGALRSTLETWEIMPGEIDFDPVLVASALREARPDLFALVSDHVHLFRYGLRDPFSPADQEGKPHAVVDRIDKLLKREDERTAAALREMLHFVFPKYPPKEGQKENTTYPPGHDQKETEYVSRPQAMFVDRHCDYWQRFKAPTQVSEAESDQSALASIVAWRSRNASDLVERVVDPQRGRQIESFIGQFLPSDLCRLLGEVADRASKQSAEGWEHRSHAPGIASVWAMMLIKRPQEDAVHRAVVEIVQRNAPIHLPLVNDVAYFFAGSNPRIQRVMSVAQQEDVRQQLLDALPMNFIGDGAEERLANALRGGSPWLIRWIAYGDRDVHTNLPFSRWPEFSSALLTLAETKPAIGVPLVVGLVAKTEMKSILREGPTGEVESGRGWVGEFDVEAAKRLFDYHHLLRVLSKFEVPDHLDEQMKASCLAAVDAARAM